jgi:hypothetical protein
MIGARTGSKHVKASIALLLCLAPGLASAQSLQYEGTAYDLDDARVLYRESHFLSQSGDGASERVVLYRCPDGTAFARKRVVYGGDAVAPSFEMEDARLGYREGVRGNGATREIFVQRESGADEQRGPLPDAKGLVADAGFDGFVQANWDALQRGDTVRFPFLVPSRLDYFNFKVRKEREETVDGVEASVFRLALGSWWAFLLPHIDVFYSNDDRQLLRFEGLTNVRDAEGDNLKARIEFPRDSRRPLAAAELAAALALPLVAACAGG